MARDVSLPRSLPVGVCDWSNVDVMDYIRQVEHHDSRRFGVFPVEAHAKRVVVTGKNQISAYGALRMRMTQWRKPKTHRAHAQMDIAFLRDRNERVYAAMPDNFIRNHIDGHRRLLGVLSY